MNLNEIQLGVTLADRFVVIKKLIGGMATVLVVQDKKSANELFVLKSIRPRYVGVDAEQKRFIEEAKSLLMLSSGYVVEMHQIVTISDTIFLHMGYCEGGNLRDKLLKNEISQEQALIYAVQICAGMRYCHHVFPGLVHGDLKLENLLLQRKDIDGPEELIKIADFGLARQSFSAPINDVPNTTGSFNLVQLESMDTLSGHIIGTIPYMPPEQLLEKENIEASSDIYSYGIILYELLSGVQPYQGSVAEIIKQVTSLEDATPLLHTIKPSVDLRVEQLIAKCMAKKPEQRFQNWTELLGAWRQIVQPKDPSNKIQFKNDEDNPRIELTSVSLTRLWLSLWPELVQKSEHIEFIKMDGHLPLAGRRAEMLLALGQEMDAIHVIDEALKLPTKTEAVIESLSKQLAEEIGQGNPRMISPDIIKNLMLIRSKCWSKIMEKTPDRELLAAATNNAVIMVSVFPKDAHCLCLVSQIFMMVGDFDFAGTVIEQAVNINRHDEFVQITVNQFWTRKGFALAKEDKLNEAKQCFDKLIQENPDDARAWFNKGAILAQKGTSDDNMLEAGFCLDQAKRLGHPLAAQVQEVVLQELGLRMSKTLDNHPNLKTPIDKVSSSTLGDTGATGEDSSQ